MLLSSLCCGQNASNAETATTPPPPDAAVETAEPASPAPDAAENRHSVLYAFEHEFLPMVWRNHAEEISEAFASEGKAGIQGLFEIVEEVYSLNYPEEKGQLDVETLVLPAGAHGWLVTFPQPKETPEANYAALLFDGGLHRYIVGEYDDLFGTVKWYLCEWADDGQNSPMQSHLNYGIQPVGTRQGFIDMVNKLLSVETVIIPEHEEESAPEPAPEAAPPAAPAPEAPAPAPGLDSDGK
ncbi:MAG: hypothetical protein WC360_04755 [Opitutales bacterium]|jgi:hypothetical protein